MPVSIGFVEQGPVPPRLPGRQRGGPAPVPVPGRCSAVQVAGGNPVGYWPDGAGQYSKRSHGPAAYGRRRRGRSKVVRIGCGWSRSSAEAADPPGWISSRLISEVRRRVESCPLRPLRRQRRLARWTVRLGLGEPIVTTKTLRRRFFALAGRLTRSAPPHPASPPALALGEPVQPRPGPAVSHSIPSPPAPPAADPSTDQPNVPANPVRGGSLLRPLPVILPASTPADGHRGPVRRLKTLRRPPVHPNGAQAISPVAASPPFRCLHAVHPCPAVDSG